MNEAFLSPQDRTIVSVVRRLPDRKPLGRALCRFLDAAMLLGFIGAVCVGLIAFGQHG